MFVGLFVVGTIVLLELGVRWTGRWHRGAVERSGVVCYRSALRALTIDRAA